MRAKEAGTAGNEYALLKVHARTLGVEIHSLLLGFAHHQKTCIGHPPTCR
jgi:hypothetical protein